MPLHDWSRTSGWEGVHHLWTCELQRELKAKLPAGFRAFIGSRPALAVGSPLSKPDIGVKTECRPETRSGTEPFSVPAAASAEPAEPEPDEEVAVAVLEATPSLFVERDNRLIAAIELVSPRNKEGPVSRATYLGRYASYLMEAVHLLLVDVQPRPLEFSFADDLASEFQLTDQPPVPPPLAVAYRVGEPAASGGRLLAIWRRRLSVGEPLPRMPLPLDVERSVLVDLESTYMRAAADAYLT